MRTFVAFERYLTRNGVVIRKFFLHVSKRSRRNGSWSGWTTRRRTGSFPLPTAAERELWDEYMDAYEDMIRNTATPNTRPGIVVPADNKWFTRLVVAAAMSTL